MAAPLRVWCAVKATAATVAALKRVRNTRDGQMTSKSHRARRRFLYIGLSNGIGKGLREFRGSCSAVLTSISFPLAFRHPCLTDGATPCIFEGLTTLPVQMKGLTTAGSSDAR